MLPRLAALAPFASRIILWDLPGHGDSPRGRFTLGAEEYRDLLALSEQITDNPGSSLDAPVILYGFSLGAGVSIHTAHTMSLRKLGNHAHPVAAIAEAPYRIPITPARNVLCMRGLPFRANINTAFVLLRARFGPSLRAANFDRAAMPFDAPLLLIHGEHDPICPVQDSREIAAARSARISIIPGGGHNNLWTDATLAPKTLAAVKAFLSTIPSVPVPSGSANTVAQ
jgi:pimeloyl-ACP methyl ester carboxylesterase